MNLGMVTEFEKDYQKNGDTYIYKWHYTNKCTNEKAMKQEEISQLLRTNREQAFLELYQTCFPSVQKQLLRYGASLEDAKDIFQDTLIVFYEKVVQQELASIQSIEAYLCGIARHLWFKKRPVKHLLPLEQVEGIAIPEDFYEKKPMQSRIARFLALAGQRCMRLLQAFYYHQQPLREIAEEFDFRNTRSATVQKYKCLEKVRAQVKIKKAQYEAIVE